MTSMTSNETGLTRRASGAGAASGWRRRRVVTQLLALPLAALAVARARPAQADNTAAEAFITGVSEEVLVILQSERSDDEKLVALKDLLDSHTDLDLVARLVLGRHWRTASEQEQQDYVGLFRQILMNTMAERIGDYDGQSFEVAGSTELNERDTAVQTRILRGGGAPPLSVDWRVRESNGSFAIIDVIAEGVSLVVSQRNEVGSIVERRGMSGLIDTMRERSREGETVL